MDPDSVFGVRVSPVDLNALFPANLYRSLAMPVAKKRRRNSCAGLLLRDCEVVAYASKMGHRKHWSALGKQLVSVSQDLHD